MPARPNSPDPTPADAAAQRPAAQWPCLAACAGGVRLAVCVSPNARRTGVDGLHDGALRVRLAAPPVDGKANELLLAWLAGELGLPRRSIRLVRGDSARRKTVEIDTAPEAVGRWLGLRLGAAAGVK
mgnify:FL=1